MPSDTSEHALSAIELAITNEARITGVIGVGTGGSNRDIKLDLDVEQSEKVLEFIKSILA